MKAPERKGDVQKKDVSGAPRSDALEMPVRNMQATEGEATGASKGTGISARSVGGLVDAVNQKKPGKIPFPPPCRATNAPTEKRRAASFISFINVPSMGINRQQ